MVCIRCGVSIHDTVKLCGGCGALASRTDDPNRFGAITLSDLYGEIQNDTRIFVLLCLGVMVSALGQILKATLDSAGHSAQFVNNEHRARIKSWDRLISIDASRFA